MPNGTARHSAPRQTAAHSGFSLNISDIYYTLFRHKWKILCCILLGVAGAAYFRITIKPPYQSEARLFIRFVITNSDAVALSEDAKLKSPDRGGETIITSELQILTSMDLLTQVAQAIGPEKILGEDSEHTGVPAAAAVLQNGLTVIAPARSSVISVLFRHRDPGLVQPVLREIIATYLRMHVEIHRSAGMVGEFLSQETDQLRSRLRQTEEELRRTTARLGVTDFAAAKKQYTDRIASLEQQIQGAQAELAEQRAILETMGGTAAPTTPEEGPAPTSLDPAILNQYTSVSLRLDSLRRREIELLAQFAPESSRVQDVRSQIADALNQKDRLEQENPSLRQANVAIHSNTSRNASIDPEAEAARIAGLESRLAVLQTQLEEARTRAVALDQQEGTIAELRRRYELEEANYRHYARSLEQSRINEALGAGRVSNISVVQQPSPPVQNFLQSLKFQVGALFAGIILGFGWAFLIELFIDRSIRRPSDIEKTTGLPLFISIPRLKRKQLKRARTSDSVALAVAETSDARTANIWAAAHALQPFHDTLRDRMISFFDAKGLTHKPKLVAVTSIGTSAGASTTAAGLARSLSETGDGNVLLVDMSPGQQSAQHFHRGQPAQGLEETLEDKEDRVQVQDNLYLANGAQSEALSRTLPRQFTKLMPKLRASDFDYIIFDMPPVSQISITPRLAEYMDMVFLVAESEETSRDGFQRAGELLSRTGASVGVVLNKNRSYVPARLDHADF